MANLAGYDIDWTSMPEKGNKPVPEGTYNAFIVKSDEKISKAGAEYIELQWKIADGEHKDRIIFDILSNSPGAQEISRNKIKTMCRLMGIVSANDTEEMHNNEISIVVKVEHSDEYGSRNRISSYKEKDISF